MIPFLVFIGLLAVLGITWFLWKAGFLRDAEHPKPVIDRPVKNSKERTAALKRFERWRQQGKLTRAEHENLLMLCESEWDPPEKK